MQISDQLFEFCVEIKFIQEEGLISFQGRLAGKTDRDQGTLII